MKKEERIEKIKKSLLQDGIEVKDFVLRGLDAGLAIYTLQDYLTEESKIRIHSESGLTQAQAQQMITELIESSDPETAEKIKQSRLKVEQSVGKSEEEREAAGRELSTLIEAELQKNLDLVAKWIGIDPERSRKKDELSEIVHNKKVTGLVLICKCLNLPDSTLNMLSIENQKEIITGVVLEEKNNIEAEIEKFFFITPSCLKI
jgi:hypothetical protein